MKKMLLLVAFLCSLHAAGLQNSTELDMKGQYGVIVVGSKTCPYCETLKKDMKTDNVMSEKIQKLSAYYVSMDDKRTFTMKIQGKKEKLSGMQIARHFKVRGTPTSVFLTPKEEVMFIIPGYLPPEFYRKILTYLTDDTIKDKSFDGLDKYING